MMTVRLTAVNIVVLKVGLQLSWRMTTEREGAFTAANMFGKHGFTYHVKSTSSNSAGVAICFVHFTNVHQQRAVSRASASQNSIQEYFL